MLLVIDQRNTHVGLDRNTLLISNNNNPPQRVPIRILDNVVVIGNATVESNVWRALAQAEITATLLPVRGNTPPAMLSNNLSVTLPLRRLQYRCAENAKTTLDVARWIISKKLNSYSLTLERLQPEPAQKMGFLQHQQQAIDHLSQIDTIESLMGIEGATASAWFRLMAQTLPENWRFTSRNRRPPKDPVNALLSLGYTLLMTEVRQVIISEGLDPALGFLHQPSAAREALTLDIAELYRAGVDHFVLNLLNDLRPVDFNYHQKTGCRLNKMARPIFYNAWASQRDHWPRQTQTTIDTAPLREQIRGQIMSLRRFISSLLEET